MLLRAEADVVTRENSVGVQQVVNDVDDHVAKRFEPRAHELHDEPAVVAVADERRACVALAVDQTVGVGDVGERGAAADRVADSRTPPRMIERGAGIAIDHAERDFRRGTPEGEADRFPAVIMNADCTGGRGWSLQNVAAVDPRMSRKPASCSFGRHDGDIFFVCVLARRLLRVRVRVWLLRSGLNSGGRTNMLRILSHVIVICRSCA